jgi:hypothetical protein
MPSDRRFINKRPCKVCGRAVIYQGAEYCSSKCWLKTAEEKELVWVNAYRKAKEDEEDTPSTDEAGDA